MDKEFKEVVIKKALSILDATNCKYHIVEDDGTEHGQPVEIKKRARKENKYAHGELQGHVKTYLEGINPGEMKSVPIDKFEINTIQASACNYMRKIHGPSSFLTARSDDKKHLNVLCLSTQKETA